MSQWSKNALAADGFLREHRFTMKRISTTFLIILFMGSAFAQFNLVKLSKVDPATDRRSYRTLAMEERDPEVANALFAAFLRSERNLKACLDAATEYSQKRGRFEHTAMYLACLLQAGVIEMATLVDPKDRNQERIAAAALSLWAQILYYESLAEGRILQTDLIEVPASMYKSKAPDVAGMAITAAAFAKVQNIWDTHLAEAPTHLPGVTGAKLLYAALNAQPIEMETVVKAYELLPRTPIREMSPAMSGPFPLFPDAANACFAIGEAKWEEGINALGAGLQNEDIRVQVEAARALVKLGGDRIVVPFARVIKDCSWPVLTEACAGLSANPDKRMIPLLMQRLQKETGRFRQPVLHTLGSIAGELHGTNATEWIAWYRESFESFEVDAAKSASFRESTTPESIGVTANSTFFNKDVTSSRFALVLDSSELMKKGKIYAVREQAFNCMAKLKKGAKYALLDYSDDIRFLDKYELSDDNKVGAFHILDMVKGNEYRRTYDALSWAMRYPEIDTIYFATAGPPLQSRLPYWEHVSYSFYLQQRYRPITIHFLDIGGAVAAAQDLKKVARENGGVYLPIETGPAGDDPRFFKDGD